MLLVGSIRIRLLNASCDVGKVLLHPQILTRDFLVGPWVCSHPYVEPALTSMGPLDHFFYGAGKELCFGYSGVHTVQG